jgi:hypothetical protein
MTMLAKHREMLSHITGVLNGLSYVVEGNIAVALLDLVQVMEKVLEEDQQQHGWELDD